MATAVYVSWGFLCTNVLIARQHKTCEWGCVSCTCTFSVVCVACVACVCVCVCMCVCMCMRKSNPVTGV